MKALLTKDNLIQLSLFIIFGIIGYFSMTCSPIGGDEPFSIFQAQKSIPDVIARLKGGNNPPLFEIILHFWIKIFGISPASVRFPSLIFSLLLLVVVYRLIRLELSKVTAVLGASIVGFSNYYIYFLHEARAYALFTLLAAVSIYLICLALKNPSKKIFYVLLGLSYVLLAYTHYFGLATILFQVSLVLVFLFRNKEFLKKYLVTLVGFGLLFSPYIPEVVHRFADSSATGTWIQPVENLGNLHDIIFLFANKSKIIYGILVGLLYAATGKYVWRLSSDSRIIKYGLLGVLILFFLVSLSAFVPMPFIWRLTDLKLFTYLFLAVFVFAIAYYNFTSENKSSLSFITLNCFLVPLLVFFIVSFKVPIFLDRYLAHIMPFFYLSVVFAASYLVKGLSHYVLGAILIVMIGTYKPSTSDHSRFDKVSTYIRSIKGKGTPVFICPPYTRLTYLYHYDIEAFKQFNDIDGTMSSKSIFPVYNSVEVESHLGTNQVVFVDVNADFSYPENNILQSLQSQYKLEDKKDFPYDLSVYIFTKLK